MKKKITKSYLLNLVRNMKPVETSATTHVFEEVYKIGEDTIVLLSAMDRQTHGHGYTVELNGKEIKD